MKVRTGVDEQERKELARFGIELVAPDPQKTFLIVGGAAFVAALRRQTGLDDEHVKPTISRAPPR